MKVYGTEKPFSYQKNYGLVDIPIHFFISLDDALIRADDVLEHYNILKSHKPELARVKVFKGFSHVDFTYGYSDALATELHKTFKSVLSSPVSVGQLRHRWWSQ